MLDLDVISSACQKSLKTVLFDRGHGYKTVIIGGCVITF